MQEDIIDEISKREANSSNALKAGSISADMLRDEVMSAMPVATISGVQ